MHAAVWRLTLSGAEDKADRPVGSVDGPDPVCWSPAAFSGCLPVHLSVCRCPPCFICAMRCPRPRAVHAQTFLVLLLGVCMQALGQPPPRALSPIVRGAHKNAQQMSSASVRAWPWRDAVMDAGLITGKSKRREESKKKKKERVER